MPVKPWLWRLYKRLETRDHRLAYLFLELTRRCNLSCLHCGSDCSASIDTPELTTESWLKIISYVHEHFGRGVTLVISGGEPLLHPDLVSIGEHIQSLETRWGMVTNGFALTASKLQQLQDAGLHSITISLDGDGEPHNWLRNNDKSFDSAMAAIRRVADSGVELADVVTCVFPGNLERLDTIAELLVDAGVKSWRLFRIFPLGRAAGNDQLLMSFEQTWQMLDWIATRRPQYEKHGLNITASCEGYVPYDKDRKLREFPFFCRAGVNIASILCDGTITGCTNNDPTFYQGNILEDDLGDVWENRFQDYRRRDWLADTVCNGCDELKSCQGGSIHLWRLGDRAPRFCYVKKDKG